MSDGVNLTTLPPPLHMLGPNKAFPVPPKTPMNNPTSTLPPPEGISRSRTDSASHTSVSTLCRFTTL
eukprot:763724-Hanusia_phi.AAC.5